MLHLTELARSDTGRSGRELVDSEGEGTISTVVPAGMVGLADAVDTVVSCENAVGRLSTLDLVRNALACVWERFWGTFVPGLLSRVLGYVPSLLDTFPPP